MHRQSSLTKVATFCGEKEAVPEWSVCVSTGINVDSYMPDNVSGSFNIYG